MAIVALMVMVLVMVMFAGMVVAMARTMVTAKNVPMAKISAACLFKSPCGPSVYVWDGSVRKRHGQYRDNVHRDGSDHDEAHGHDHKHNHSD